MKTVPWYSLVFPSPNIIRNYFDDSFRQKSRYYIQQNKKYNNNSNNNNNNNSNNNNNCRLCCPDWPKNKTERMWKERKYLDLARELKKLWNMKMTIIPIVIGAFGTVTEGLLTGLENLDVGWRVETIQTTALLRRPRILRRVLETWGDLLSLRLQWKTTG